MVAKVIMLREPFATLVELGIKTLESRSWNTLHRGPLFVGAALRAWEGGPPLLPATLPRDGLPAEVLEVIDESNESLLRWALARPRGVLRCQVSVLETRRAKATDQGPACYAVPEGHYVWQLDETIRRTKDVKITGAQGIFQRTFRLLPNELWRD